MKQQQPIKVGDRFQTKDKRDEGRVVEVLEARGLSTAGRQHVELLERKRALGAKTTHWGWPIDDAIEDARQGYTYFAVRTEAHPRNPDALGNVSRISERTLRAKYRRISR
ncbi:hypothetical protein [Agromyces sp. NPDC058064]|uniref:hypothetical protein n=1 Tax=Agromyces sp. NPDC058064 TaxID=3346322 RepID=UPI0036D82A6A